MVSRAIIRAQRRGHILEEAMWTHAAVYAGDSVSICDSTPSKGWGVATRYLYDYIGRHLILVRRGPDLTDDQRWQIVVKATGLRGLGYSVAGLVGLSGRFLLARKHDRVDASLSSRAVICSRLYADAYLRATKRFLQDPGLGEATPAFLSQTQQLVDVPSRWVGIYGCTPS